MSAFLEGLGKVFGKVADQFQGRIERLKNEREKLVTEKINLQRKVCDEKIADRILTINARIVVIDGLLKSSAKD